MSGLWAEWVRWTNANPVGTGKAIIALFVMIVGLWIIESDTWR